MYGDREEALDYIEMAKKNLDKGLYSKAIQDATYSMRLKSFSQAYLYRGLAYHRLGNYLNGMQDLKHGLDIMDTYFDRGQGSDDILQDYTHGCLALSACYVNLQDLEGAKKYREKVEVFMATTKKLKGRDQLKKLREEIYKLERDLNQQKVIQSQAQVQEEEDFQKALEASKMLAQNENKEDYMLQEAIKRSKAEAQPKKEDPKIAESAASPTSVPASAAPAAVPAAPLPKEQKPPRMIKEKFEMRANRALTFEFDPQLRQDQTAQEFGFSELYFGKNGLENLGNTCYMNSVIQSLAGILEIKNYFLQNGEEPHIIDEGDYDLLPKEQMEDLLDMQRSRPSLMHFELDELPRKDSVFSQSIEYEQAEIPEEKEKVGLEDSINSIKVKEAKSQKLERRLTQQEEKRAQASPQDKKLEEEKAPQPEVKLIKHFDGMFTRMLAEIIKELWVSKSRSLMPDSFHQLFTQIVPQFRGFTQQDAAECLTHLLEILHNELNVSIAARHMKQLQPQLDAVEGHSWHAKWTKFWLKNQSLITHLFTGMGVSTLKCAKCKRVDSQPQFFNMHTLPLPGNMEYKVKFVPLSDAIRDKLRPLSFQIQIKEHQFLTKELILKQSMEIITFHYSGFKIDRNMISLYQEMSTGKNGMFIEFNQETGLHEEENCLFILEHPLFQKVEGRLPLNILPLPVHFDNNSYYKKIQEYLIIPFEEKTTMKEVKAFLKRYVEKRISASKERMAAQYMEYGYGREIELDFKIFDNLPVDPTSVTGMTVVCQFCGSSHYSNRNCDLSYRFNESPLQVMMEFTGNRQFEIVVNFSYSVSDVKKQEAFKKTEDLSNPNIDFKKVKLEDCLARSFKPENLENYECEKCGAKEGQSKELEIYRLPPVLVIQLKRFLVKKNDAFNFFKTLKNNIFVDFPITHLNMEPYLAGSKEKQEGGHDDPAQSKESAVYSLSSVVYHTGSFESGHYFTKRKQIKRYQEDAWVELNDSKAKEVSTSVYIDGLKKELKTPAAYMLFYRRIQKGEEKVEQRAPSPPGLLKLIANINRKRNIY